MSDRYSPGVLEGYHGIMPLDLADIDPAYRAQATERHKLDIRIYREEELLLPQHLRYENTILRVQRIHAMDSAALAARTAQLRLDQARSDDACISEWARRHSDDI